MMLLGDYNWWAPKWMKGIYDRFGIQRTRLTTVRRPPPLPPSRRPPPDSRGAVGPHPGRTGRPCAYKSVTSALPRRLTWLSTLSCTPTTRQRWLRAKGKHERPARRHNPGLTDARAGGNDTGSHRPNETSALVDWNLAQWRRATIVASSLFDHARVARLEARRWQRRP